VKNAASGAYPYYKRFFLVSGSDPGAPVQRFIGFVQSKGGRDILSRNGHWVP
jgi:hypothetical protein